MIDKIKKCIDKPRLIIVYMLRLPFFRFLSDEVYLKLLYKCEMGKSLDIDNPVTFNEKLQWLKVNNRSLDQTKLVDKYEVRKYIKEKLGEEYLVPLLGVWDRFDDIDFSALPNQFVLKCTHDSGGLVICTDKNTLNMKLAKEKINDSLSRNYYYTYREWPYKNIKPRIICEELIQTSSGALPIDYKFHCFNGKVDNVMLCLGRETGNTKFYFFNEKWELLRYNITGKNAPIDFTLDKPMMMNKMFEIAKELSKDLPFVRVDLYCEDNKIFFGEMTFYPQSGFDFNLLEETDRLFGEKIILKKL